jgi:hypothetical protein
MYYSYSEIALEAVRNNKAEKRFLQKYDSAPFNDQRHLLWESAADAYDEANFCRYLLLEPEEFYRRQSTVA